MTTQRTLARNALMARGFTEGEAVHLLCKVIAEAYRDVAEDLADNWGTMWGDTPDEAFAAFAAAYRKTADSLDPPSGEGE